MTATEAPEVPQNAHLVTREALLRPVYEVSDEPKPQALLPYTIDEHPETDDLGVLATRIDVEAKVARLRAEPSDDRILSARAAARRHYPGPVGEMLDQIIESWGGIGYRFGAHTLMNRLMDNLLGREEPLEYGGVVHRAEVE